MELSLLEYKAIVEFSPNMIWRAGIDAKCNYFNETWLKFTGKLMEDEVGNGWTNGVHPEDFDFCLKKYLDSFHKRESFEMEYRLIRFDGEYRWINDRGVPFFGDNGDFAGYIGSCMDVTDKVEGRKLTEMAHRDKLTGLNNRNYLDYLLSYEFLLAKEEETDSVILMMDVDHFKYFNDHYGHGFGDKVLKQVAMQIAKNIRQTDIAGRYGGDEFLIVLQRATLDNAKAVAKKILNSIREINIENTSEKISLSIGIAKQSNESEVSEIIEKADKAMYYAKQTGGDKFSLFEELVKN